MLLILSFVACLSTTQGDRCQNVEIAWEGGLHQCMMFGQHQIAAWTNEHPGYLPKRGYRCVAGRSV